MKSPEVKLTVKRATFLKEYLKHGNGTKAAMVAFDVKDENSASSLAYETLRKLENPMRLLMEKRGITALDLIKTVDEARTATKWNDFTGDREPDHNIRLKAVSQMSKWAGYDPKETPQQQTNVQVNMGVSFTDD